MLYVIELVNQNHLKVNPFEIIVNDGCERFNLELEKNKDPFGQQENNEAFNQESQQLEEFDTDSYDADLSEIENQTRYANETFQANIFFPR